MRGLWIYIAIAFLLALAVGVVFLYFYFKKSSASSFLETSAEMPVADAAEGSWFERAATGISRAADERARQRSAFLVKKVAWGR